MNNETATAVTAEAVTAAATQAAASQKIAAKSIAETSTQETTDRSSWLKVITTSVLIILGGSTHRPSFHLAHQDHGSKEPARLYRRPRGDRQSV